MQYICIYEGTELTRTEVSISDYEVLDGFTLYAYQDGTAEGTKVKNGGAMYVSGGTASDTKVQSGGVLTVNSGDAENIDVWAGGSLILNGAASEIDMSSGSSLEVRAGGTAQNVTCYINAKITVQQGGALKNVAMRNGSIQLAGGSASGLRSYAGTITICSGAVAEDVTLIQSGVVVSVEEGGKLTEAENCGGSITVASGGVVSSSVIDGYMNMDTGELFCGEMTLASGAIHKGTLSIASGYGTLTAETGSIIDFTVAEASPDSEFLIDNFAGIQGAPSFTLTVSDEQESGRYCLADKVADFTYTITVQNTEGQQLGELSLVSVLERVEGSYALSLEDGQLCLTVTRNSPYALSGDADGISWKGNGELFNVQYSQDGFEHVLSLESTEKSIDTFALPEGTYQWRVQEADDVAWVQGDDITATAQEADASSWCSVSNGAQDIFFASGKGTWNSAYKAQHVGTLNGWEGGTGEEVVLAGKNRIADTFTGSDDANILMLTDDANGDALFVDDIYTAFPDKKQSRIAQLDEICAGAGDDLVDMTSQRFTYQGDGLIIRGGDGNDTIWASGGNNTLLGDCGDDRLVGASDNDVLAGGAGDDSLHGGGGNDIFCFCEEWGDDTIEQLTGADNSVTLWFKESSDELSLTFTMEGNDTVITAASGDTITALGMTLTAADCRFGDGSSTRAVVVVSEDYSRLSALGAFDASSSTCIFAEA